MFSHKFDCIANCLSNDFLINVLEIMVPDVVQIGMTCLIVHTGCDKKQKSWENAKCCHEISRNLHHEISWDFWLLFYFMMTK